MIVNDSKSTSPQATEAALRSLKKNIVLIMGGKDKGLDYKLLKEQVEDVLHTLTERERRVLQFRFGLEDGRSRTLEEVGREFGVTRERIRQIEAKALRKLRHPTRSRKLRDFLE